MFFGEYIIGAFVLFLLALIVAFPVYVIIRLVQLGSELKDIRRRLDRIDWKERGEKVKPPAAAPQRPQEQIIRERPHPQPERLSAAAPPPPPPPPPKVPPREEPARAPKPPRDIESVLGANWLSKVGIAAIILAASFFLKYAIDSGWIGPTARVAIGLAAAAGLLGLAQYLIVKPVYRTYAQVLAAGGIVILFLSIWAAYHLYHIIGYGAAFAVLALAAVAISAVAVRDSSEAVAVLAIIGAFATPLLLQQTGTSSGNMVGLYVYLAGLNLWSVILAKMRAWNSLIWFALGATWIIFFGAGDFGEINYLMVEAFVLLFLLFSCYGAVRTARTPETPSTQSNLLGLLIILGGVAAFSVASIIVLEEVYLFGLSVMWPLGLLLAVLLVGLAGAFANEIPAERKIRQVLLVCAAIVPLYMVVFSISATPLFMRSAPEARPVGFAFSLAYYLLFLIFSCWLSQRERSSRAAGVMVFANSVLYIWALDNVLGRVLVWGVGAQALWLPVAAWISLVALWFGFHMEKEKHRGLLGAVVALFFLLTSVFVAAEYARLWAVETALGLFCAEFLLLSATWVILRRSIDTPWLRADAVVAFGNAATFFTILAFVARMETYQGLVMLCGCAVALAAYHALVGAFALRAGAEGALHRFLYLGIALTFVTIAVPLQLKASYITLAWAAESVILLWTGYAVRNEKVRWFGLSLLALTIGKTFFLDMPESPEAFRLLLNSRMLAGAAAIAACYLAAWLVLRGAPDDEKKESWAATPLLIIAGFFTLIFVSLDLWDYFGRTLPAEVRGSGQQLALSIYWSIYALGLMSVGIWRRIRTVRLFAMGLLYFSVIKVFVFDLGFLEVPYRIVSFLGLGVVLLVVSLLYTKFESRLKCEPS